MSAVKVVQRMYYNPQQRNHVGLEPIYSLVKVTEKC